MKNTIVFFLLSLFLCIHDAAAQSPLVHTEAHFAGQSQALRAGNYRTADLTIGDKAITSIQLPKGFKMLVFDKDNFQGESLEVTISLPNLDFWSKRISSIQVIDLQQSVAIKPTNKQTTTNTNTEKKQDKKTENQKANTNKTTENKQTNKPNNPPTTNTENRQTSTTNKQTTDSKPKKNQAWWETDKVSVNYSTDDVVVFADKDFQGQGQILAEGGFDEAELALGKNKINSIKIPQGYTVRLFENAGFGGGFVDLKNEVNDLYSAGWGGKIASIRVFKGNAPAENVVTDEDWYNGKEADQIVAYQYADFEGKTNVLTVGNYPSLDKMPVRNYDVSSIRVPVGLVVRLYGREDYAGAFVDISENTSSLEKIGWDNRAMSMRISRKNANKNTDNQEVIIATLPNNSANDVPTTNRNPNPTPNPNQSIFSNWNRTYRMRHNGTNFRIRIINDSNRNNTQVQTQSGNSNWTMMRVVATDNQRGVYRIRDNDNNEFDLSLQGNGGSLVLNDGSRTWTYWAE